MISSVDKVTVEIIFEDEHWNQNAACMIPAAWVAYMTDGEETLPKWPCGDTREEAEQNVLREFPNAEIS